jgi:DNA-directed RNA polymerase I subunit RPA1
VRSFIRAVVKEMKRAGSQGVSVKVGHVRQKSQRGSGEAGGGEDDEGERPARDEDGKASASSDEEEDDVSDEDAEEPEEEGEEEEGEADEAELELDAQASSSVPGRRRHDSDSASSSASSSAASSKPTPKRRSLSSKPASLKKPKASFSAPAQTNNKDGLQYERVACDVKAECFRDVMAVTGLGVSYVEMRLEFPASVPRLLLVQLAEKAAASEAVRSTAGISDVAVVDGQVVTAGCNLGAVWELEGVKYADIATNDVGQVLDTFGVEAARACIVRQLRAVFDPYGIEIDLRHLGLVADHMTFEGGFRAFSRAGVDFSTSPFLRITYETSAKFLVSAALKGDKDVLETPSASISTGQVMKLGTGGVQLLVKPVKERQRAAAGGRAE